MGSVCRLLEGPELEALAPEIAVKLGLGLRRARVLATWFGCSVH